VVCEECLSACLTVCVFECLSVYVCVCERERVIRRVALSVRVSYLSDVITDISVTLECMSISLTLVCLGTNRNCECRCL
jgi:hypothetical protein